MDNNDDDTDVPDVDIDIDGINSNEEVQEVQIEKPGKLMSFPFKNSYLMIIYPVLEITIEAADDKTNEQVWIGLICFLVTLIVAMAIGAIVCWKKCSRRTNGQDDGIEMVAF